MKQRAYSLQIPFLNRFLLSTVPEASVKDKTRFDHFPIPAHLESNENLPGEKRVREQEGRVRCY
jgi:hypothetical protein